MIQALFALYTEFSFETHGPHDIAFNLQQDVLKFMSSLPIPLDLLILQHSSFSVNSISKNKIMAQCDSYRTMRTDNARHHLSTHHY